MKVIELLKSKEWSGKVIDCVLRFALSFALALAQVFGGYAPLALGMIGASGAGLRGVSALIGASAGAVLFLPFSHALRHLRRGRSDLHGEQRVFRSETLQKAGVSAAAVRGDDVLRRVCLRLTRRRGRGGKLPDGAAAVRARRDERPRAFVDRRQGKGGPPLRAAFHPARRADGRVLVRNGGRLCAGSHPLDAGGAAVRL